MPTCESCARSARRCPLLGACALVCAHDVRGAWRPSALPRAPLRAARGRAGVGGSQAGQAHCAGVRARARLQRHARSVLPGRRVAAGPLSRRPASRGRQRPGAFGYRFGHGRDSCEARAHARTHTRTCRAASAACPACKCACRPAGRTLFVLRAGGTAGRQDTCESPAGWVGGATQARGREGVPAALGCCAPVHLSRAWRLERLGVPRVTRPSPAGGKPPQLRAGRTEVPAVCLRACVVLRASRSPCRPAP